MKKLILITLFFTSTICFAQDNFITDTIAKDYYFEKVHEANDSLKPKSKAKSWIALNFKDANSVIKNESDSEIILKGLFEINYTSMGYPISSNVHFTMIVQFKEDRYRMQLKDMYIPVELAGDQPIYNYAHTSSFQDFRKSIVDLEANPPDKITGNYYKRLLKNPAKLQKMFDDGNAIYAQVINQVKEECIRIDSQLFNYISSKSSAKDDW